jgi:hypothetical protein
VTFASATSAQRHCGFCAGGREHPFACPSQRFNRAAANAAFADLQRISADMERQFDTLMQQARTIGAVPAGDGLMDIAAGKLPPGTVSYSMGVHLQRQEQLHPFGGGDEAGGWKIQSRAAPIRQLWRCEGLGAGGRSAHARRFDLGQDRILSGPLLEDDSAALNEGRGVSRMTVPATGLEPVTP